MTTTTPGTTTKICPRCAEEIKLEAKVCHFCRAQFTVEHHGYCTGCHAVVTLADGAQTCPVCNGPLVDILTDSHLVEETTPPRTTAPAPATAMAPPMVAAAPPAPPTPASGQPPQPRVAPVGKLRRAVVPTMLQSIGMRITALATMGLIFVPIMTFVFEGMRLSATTGAYVAESKALGPGYIVIGFVVALLMPWRAIPKVVDGSRIRANVNTGPFMKRVRAELHAQGLFRAGGFVARLAVVVALWLGSLGLFLATGGTPEGWETRAGTPTMWTVLIVGLVSSVLTLPFRRIRYIRLDDEGNFFPDEVSGT